MKFYSIRKPDFFLFLLFASFFGLSTATGQNLSQSPYGRYALGDQLPNPSAWSQSLGGSSLAVNDSSVLNLAQPASLTSMGVGVSIFEGSISGQQRTYSTASLKATGRTAGYSSVALAFPIIKKRWSTAIHLMPLTNVGYLLRDSIETEQEGKILFNYDGKGGLSAVGMTHSLQLTKDWAIGAEVRYLFGKSSYYTETSFPDQLLQVRATRITSASQINDFDARFGMTFQHRFRRPKKRTPDKSVLAGTPQTRQSKGSDSLHVKLGFTFRPSFSLSGTSTLVAESFFGSGNSAAIIDTALFRNQEKGEFVMPMQFGGGLSLGSSSNKWLFTADYRYTDWSGFRIFGQPDSVRSSFTASAGLQWIPSPNKNKLLARSAYRLGGYYSDGMLKLNGNAVPEYGISIGVGLPFVVPTYYRKPVMSMLNLALTFGQRGSINPNLLQEQFIRLSVGFSLNDRWFVRTRFE